MKMFMSFLITLGVVSIPVMMALSDNIRDVIIKTVIVVVTIFVFAVAWRTVHYIVFQFVT